MRGRSNVMFYKVVLTAVLWTVVSGQSKPRPCCTDHQFEMTLGEVAGSFYGSTGHPTSTIVTFFRECYGIGISTIATGENIVHFDEYRRKSVIESRLVDLDGNRVEMNIFVDFNLNKQYVQYPNGTCHAIAAYQAMGSPCIPANATYRGTTELGYGPNAVETNHFQVHFTHSDTRIRLAVTKYGCIPVVHSVYGHKGHVPGGKIVDFDMVFLVTNFKPGLSKPALFDIFPTNCISAQSDEMIPAHTRRAVHAFNLLFAE